MLALLAAWAGPAASAPAATGPGGDDRPIEVAVDELVQDALAANLQIDVAGAEVSARLAALDQARARYLPVLDLNARYSAADGGRVISIPVGDLLNPVYLTLNQLTGQQRFPAIQNQSFSLLRSREQETKLSLTQPLYDARITPARAASAAQYEGALAARAALASRIERDMRTAYYHWLEAGARLGILDATQELASANRRVNQSLYDNGKITRDLVYRAEADLLEVEQSRLAAGNGVRIAQSYVNLLRNASFDTPLPRVRVDDDDVARLRDAALGRIGLLQREALTATALERRAELRGFDAATAAAAAGERLARAAFKPQFALAVDAGTQGVTYGLGADDRYVLASVVMRFNLFAGGADRAGLAAAHAAGREARANRALAESRIRLEVEQAADDLDVALASLATAARRVDAAQGAFRIAARKRDLGQINQAEFIDARRVVTDAELNRNVTRFTALADLAELEYALGAGRRSSTLEPPP